jgi:integrase
VPKPVFTDKSIAALAPRAKRYSVADPQLPGHYVRVTPVGGKSYVAVASDPHTGKQVWATIGVTAVLDLAEAREMARAAIRRIKQGQAPFEPPPPPTDTFADVVQHWLVRHVQAKKLRTEGAIRWTLDRFVLPRWKDRAFVAIRRSDIAKLLDEVEDRGGTRQADIVLALIRGIANWHAARDDDYTPPFVKAMRRQTTAERARKRVLDDTELREVWRVAEGSGSFGALVQLMLLLAQRREKLLSMRWDGISADGVWTVRTQAREKGNAIEIRLPARALAIIAAQPRLASNDFIFPGRRDGHMDGMNSRKRRFDAKLTNVAPYVLHDLRRTARTLLARCGVSRDVAEAILGHSVGGIEQTYNRHRYFEEKSAALARLAEMIDSILDPRDNVVALRQGT